ncbi:MAG: aminotransferase class IV [Planctomycetes bacterium]|nr:aminotransferase class IV [Planctomycetota bacterium]
MKGVFETLRIVVERGVPRAPLWPRHRARALDSLRALGIQSDVLAALAPRLDAALAAAIASPSADAGLRVRVHVEDGRPRIECSPRALPGSGAPLRVQILPAPWQAPDPSHKLLDRRTWERLEASARARGAAEALTLRRDGTLGETSRGNLLLLLDSVFATPPLDGTILPGIARAVLLEGLRARGRRVDERPVGLDEFAGATGLWSTNALAGPRVIRAPRDPAEAALPASIWAAALAEAAAAGPASQADAGAALDSAAGTGRNSRHADEGDARRASG